MILTNELAGVPTEVLQDAVKKEQYATLRLQAYKASRLGGNTPKEAASNELYRRHLNYVCAVELAEWYRKRNLAVQVGRSKDITGGSATGRVAVGTTASTSDKEGTKV